MPLTSLTLSGNQRLRDCLLNDSAHVTPGSRGEHVGLIQKCLLLLDRTQLASSEIEGKIYGPTTAAAVLSYKRKRNIINRAYQQNVDNIVGKLTIARLDAEIRRAELSPNFGVGCAEFGGGNNRQFLSRGSFALAGGSTVGAPGRPAPVKLNRQLEILLQRTTSAAGSDTFIDELIKRARVLLAPHGLSLNAGLALSPPPIAYPDAIVKVQLPVERFAIRKAAGNTLAAPENVLRVIFCPFDPASNLHGFTDGGPRADDTDSALLPRFVLINVTKQNPDRGTLLHEMCHAAFPEISPPHEADASSVYSVAEARTQLPNNFALQLSNAFFKR